MGRKYHDEVAGRWIQPARKGYRLACCDCGLVHRFDFTLTKVGKRNYILFRCYRDNRATGQVRRHMGRKARA